MFTNKKYVVQTFKQKTIKGATKFITTNKLESKKSLSSMLLVIQLHSKHESTWYNSKRIAFKNTMNDCLGKGRTIVHHNIAPNNRSQSIRTDEVHLSESEDRSYAV